MRIIPIILSGGAGTRLWPLSRATYPKQFLNLYSTELTLIQETCRRVKEPGFFPPIIICNAEHRFIVAEQLRQINIESPTIILEPVGRNTAPALTIAALYVKEAYGENAVMLAMPSDHIIKDSEKFLSAVRNGIGQAEKGSLVSFGIKPTHPEIAYGYINNGEIIDKERGISITAGFVEKPDLETAKEYVRSGNYSWNSGILLFSAKTYLSEIKKFKPEIIDLCIESIAKKVNDMDFIRLDEKSFAKLPSVSVDYAVMEYTKKGVTINIDCGWSDIGSWDSLWDMLDKDKNGNVVIGKANLMDTGNSYVRSDGATINMLGVDNLIVVSTKDAILVANKNMVQDLKALVEKIRKTDAELADSHTKVYRPWGYYESIDEGGRYKVKHINVKPGEKLSLQMHHHRSEHWIVVRGTAKVYLDGKEYFLSENRSFYVPMGAKHSLENPGKINLDLIEIQVGAYLGEDDIIRFEDRYNRINQLKP